MAAIERFEDIEAWERARSKRLAVETLKVLW